MYYSIQTIGKGKKVMSTVYGSRLIALRSFLRNPLGHQLIQRHNGELSELATTKRPKQIEKVLISDSLSGPLPSLYGPATHPEALAVAYVSPYLSQKQIEPLEGIQRRVRPVAATTVANVYGQYVTSDRAKVLRDHPRLQPKPFAHSVQLSAIGAFICSARGAAQIMKRIAQCAKPFIQDESALA